MTDDGGTGREFHTSIGDSDSESITVLGQNLADDLMGKVGFGELAFWLVALRRPTSAELRLFEAVLVALAEHGLTPSVIAARLTLTGAPESVQGAIAAGLLGGGSRFLGVTEDAGRFLVASMADWRHSGRTVPETDAGWDDLAKEAIDRQRASGHYVPGLGHNVHREVDPRVPALLAIAAQEGLLGPHLRLFEAVGRVHPEILKRRLPLNGAGACGAALCDLGFPVAILRGFAILARAAGLLGHLAEEIRQPLGFEIYQEVDGRSSYVAPPEVTR